MPKKDTTILIFSPAFAANEQDNWLPWLQNTVMAMNTNFPELKIIIFSFKYPYHSRTYQWKNNEVISFGGERENKIITLRRWSRVFMAFYKKKRVNNIVGILSIWCGECAYIANLCAKAIGIKHLSWIAGQDARAGNKHIKKIRPKAEQLIAMSDFLRTEFYTNYAIRPAYIIPTAINKNLYSTELLHKTIDILGVGNLCSLKQYSIFIDVVGEIRKSLPLVKAEICGDGEEKTDLQKKIALLQLEQTITLNGELKHTDAIAKMQQSKVLCSTQTDLQKKIALLQLEQTITLNGELKHTDAIAKMQQSKILLHPSSYEGCSNVCLEALYAGAHVVSFTYAMESGIKNWHVVKTKEEMVEKTIALLTDTSAAHEQVFYHSFDDTAKKLVKLFL